MKKKNIFISSYYFPTDIEKNKLTTTVDSYISGPSVDLYDLLLIRPRINNIIYFRYPLLSRKSNLKLIIQGRIEKYEFFHELPIIKLSWYKSQHQNFLQTFLYKLGEIYYLTKALKKYSKIKFDYVWTTESIQFLVAKIFFLEK